MLAAAPPSTPPPPPSHPAQTAAARAREFIKAGGEPRCLMDFWAQKCLAEIEEAEAEGLPPPSHTTIHRMVRTAGGGPCCTWARLRGGPCTACLTKYPDRCTDTHLSCVLPM